MIETGTPHVLMVIESPAVEVQGRRTTWPRWLLVGLVLATMLVVVGCESDLHRTREANEAARESRTSVPEVERRLPSHILEVERQLPSAIPNGPSADRVVSYRTLQEGECFNGGPDPSYVELVPCTGKWESRVVSSFVVDQQGPYPGNDYFARTASEQCDRQYTYYLHPTVESWLQGDSVVTCFQKRYDLASTEPERRHRMVNYSNLPEVECKNDKGWAPATVLTVPCTGGGQPIVIGSFEVALEGSYPGEEYFDQQATEHCPSRSDAYVSPSLASWATRDNVVTCIDLSDHSAPP